MTEIVGAVVAWLVALAIVVLFIAAGTPPGGWLRYLRDCPLWSKEPKK